MPRPGAASHITVPSHRIAYLVLTADVVYEKLDVLVYLHRLDVGACAYDNRWHRHRHTLRSRSGSIRYTARTYAQTTRWDGTD